MLNKKKHNCLLLPSGMVILLVVVGLLLPIPGAAKCYGQNFIERSIQQPQLFFQEHLDNILNIITFQKNSKVQVLYYRGESYYYNKGKVQSINHNISIKRGFINTKKSGFLILKRGKNEYFILLPNSILEINKKKLKIIQGSLYAQNLTLPSTVSLKANNKVKTMYSPLGNYLYTEGTFVINITENNLKVLAIQGIGVFKHYTYQTILRKSEQLYFNAQLASTGKNGIITPYDKSHQRLFHLYRNLATTTQHYQHHTIFLRQSINSIIAAYQKATLRNVSKNGASQSYSIVFNSQPKKVQIFYKNKKIANQTPFKYTVRAGLHLFKIVNLHNKQTKVINIDTATYKKKNITVKVDLLIKKPILSLTFENLKGIKNLSLEISNKNNNTTHQLSAFKKKNNTYQLAIASGDYQLIANNKGYQTYHWNFSTKNTKNLKHTIKMKTQSHGFTQIATLPKINDHNAKNIRNTLSPLNINVSQQGIFVTSVQDSSVHYFNLDGIYKGFLNTKPSYQFILPSDLAFSTPNSLFVSDTRNNRVVHFNYNAQLKTWNYHSILFNDKNKKNPLKLPQGIATFHQVNANITNTHIAIANTYANQIILTKQDQNHFSIIKQSAIREPKDLIFLSKSVLVVIQWGKHPSILKISASNSIIQNIKLDYIPNAITKDDKNNIYILNARASKILIYNSNLQKINSISIKQQNDSKEAKGIAFYQDHMYVAFNNSNRAIVIYQRN